MQRWVSTLKVSTLDGFNQGKNSAAINTIQIQVPRILLYVPVFKLLSIKFVAFGFSGNLMSV